MTGGGGGAAAWLGAGVLLLLLLPGGRCGSEVAVGVFQDMTGYNTADLAAHGRISCCWSVVAAADDDAGVATCSGCDFGD